MTTERDDNRLDGDIDDAEAGSLTDEERAEAADIRADIEETREEMGGTLNELGDRLEPGHLMNQAKDNVRDATIGRVEETARGMSDMVMDTIKRNPIPAALAGAGLALLWINRSNGNARRPVSVRRLQRNRSNVGAGEKFSEMGSTVGSAVGTVREGAGEAVSNVAQGATEAADEVGLRFERFMQASPLAVGAIAVGAGALAGSIIPETPHEQNLLGDASRQVVNTVRETVDEVATKAEETLEQTEQQVAAGS